MTRETLTLLLCGCCSLLPAQSHTIRAGIVLDGRGNSLANQTIEIQGGEIVAIKQSDSLPDMDLSGATVMPGWIGACLSVTDSDSLAQAESKAFRLLQSGFTTVISPSVRMRDLIDDQRWAGPRILPRGSCRGAEEIFYAARKGVPITLDDLANVTARAAETLGIADRTGTLAPGMIADLVAVRGNPLVNGSALRDVVCVMKNGHIYREPNPPERKKLILRR